MLHGKRSMYRQLCAPPNSRFGGEEGGQEETTPPKEKLASAEMSPFAFASFMKPLWVPFGLIDGEQGCLHLTGRQMLMRW